jgi:hypothetical protein
MKARHLTASAFSLTSLLQVLLTVAVWQQSPVAAIARDAPPASTNPSVVEKVASDTNHSQNDEGGPVTQSTPLSTWITIVKDTVNILFFLLIGLLTLLTYLHARRTFFTPFRAETFKAQLKAFEDVTLYFQYEVPADLLERFDLQNILIANAAILCDNYAVSFLGVSPTNETEEKRRSSFVGHVLSKDFVQDHIGQLQIKPSDVVTLNGRAEESDWAHLTFGAIGFSEKYSHELAIVRKFAKAPILPRHLRTLIEIFADSVHANLLKVGDTLTEVAKEFPDKYPAEKWSGFDISWIWNRYNREIKSLNADADRILDCISEYVNVNGVFER